MFYTLNVDIASTKSMWNFLKNHYTYYTMNSWNRTISFAHNVKLYNLNLDGDWSVAMRYIFDEADTAGLQIEIDDMIHNFHESYPGYKVGFNGRSNGYLVLYSEVGSGSVIPSCVDDFDCYDDFKADCKESWNGWRVSDFNYELRTTVEIVRAFDRLCDSLRDLVNAYSLRSFDTDVLSAAVDSFNYEYQDDLDDLELEGPVLEGDKVKLNDIQCYKAFMHCFLEYLGDERRRIVTNDTHLWLRAE